MKKFQLVCVCVLLIAIPFTAIAWNEPTKITQEQGSIANPSELIWLGASPNINMEPYGICGTGLPAFYGYRYSGLIINESGEVIHKVIGRSTQPAQLNAIRLGWNLGMPYTSYPATPSPMHYGQINDGTPVSRVFINEQGDTFSYRSSTNPKSIGDGWFRCEVTQKHNSWGGADSKEKPSDEFFLSPDLQRIDSIKDVLGIQLAHETKLDRDSDQLASVGEQFVVIIDPDYLTSNFVIRSNDPDRERSRKKYSERASVKTGFINTTTGDVSTHKCGYVRVKDLTFDSRNVIITSNWESESLYDPINDTVYFSVYKIMGLLDDNRAIVLLNKGDQHYQIVDKQGESLGTIEDKIRIDHVSQDGVVQYSISDPNMHFNHESLVAKFVVDETQAPTLDPIDVSKYDNICPSTNPAFYATQTNSQYAIDHNEPIKQYVLNASLQIVLEFDATEHPMLITRSGKVLTYSEISKQYTLYTPEGQIIQTLDVAQELDGLMPSP